MVISTFSSCYYGVIDIVFHERRVPYMNQVKVGKFIAECRKQNGYTQAELAEKLGLSDKTISKWEPSFHGKLYQLHQIITGIKRRYDHFSP